MDVVDTEKENTIRDNINMSGKTTLTNPMIIDLAETADETNLELSKVEAAPRRKSSTEMDLLSDWLPRDDPVSIDTIKGELKEDAKLLFSGGKVKRLA